MFPTTQLIEEGQRHDPSGTPVSPYIHGSGGLFNMTGADMRVMSAIMSPIGGLMAALPVVSGEYGTAPNSFGAVDEEASIALTGITAGELDDWDNQPTEDCATGPTGGLLKAGTYINPYGRIRGATREVSLVRAGRLASLCEPLTLSLMNQPDGFGGIASPTNAPSLVNAVNNELANRIYESLHSMQRMFSRRLWVGNPANNVGERKDIWGLEYQINTGTHIDRTSSAVLRALDPDVKAFNYDIIGKSGRNIVQYLEAVDQYVHFKADSMGLEPFDYDLAMRYGAFMEATAAWPITQSFRAFREMALYSGGSLSIDANAVLAARNDMRKNYYLPINGRNVRVIIDSSIPEKNVTNAAQLSAGQYASDIFGVPRMVRGNMPATFWKYHNHNNGQEASLAALAGTFATFTSDNGVFRWYVDFKDGCLVLKWEFSPKLVMLAPQLAFRITNVGYEPMQHEAEVYPDSDYFFNGGNTNSPIQKFYTGWSPTTPVAV